MTPTCIKTETETKKQKDNTTKYKQHVKENKTNETPKKKQHVNKFAGLRACQIRLHF